MELRLYHDSHDSHYRSRFGAVPSGSELTLRLSVSGRPASSCKATVRLWQSNAGESLVPMTAAGDTFAATWQVPQKGCLLWYYFIVEWDGKRLYYGNNQDHLGGVGALYDTVPPAFQITVYDKNAHTPDWFKHAIVYQIFPDRFCRGRMDWQHLAGKPGAVIHSSWDDRPYYCKNTETGDVVQYDFFGGDLAGIGKKLDYLADLGVTAIYLNPVFESCSNHRYGTGDYHRIDPFLGTNDEFSALCEKARKRGIRIILDGVFSHTGADSIYFNRFGHYPSLGAYQSKESPYYEWYRFTDYPDDYESWWGVKDLPDVEETTPSYMDFIIRSENSVLKYWLGQGISGWRLDVIDELPVPFLRSFYHTLKEENPDAVLIGEVWEDASNKIAYSEQREYLCGYDIDSAMNYALRAMAVAFVLGQKDGGRLGRELMQLVENYPPENWYAMLNLISSHDIERILTVCQSSDADVRGESVAMGRVKLLMAWQMTMPGAPCIYYGDEAGLTGGKDPDNRRTYPWGHENMSLLRWVKRLTALRRKHDALQTGRFIPLYSKGDVYVYCRSIEGGRDVFDKPARDGLFVIAINRSTTAVHSISLYTDGLLYGKLYNALIPNMEPLETTGSRLDLTLPPLSIVVLAGQEGGKRRAGILLHPTSLPSPWGCGDLGEQAYHFIDFLKTAGQSLWQVLPLTPPLDGDSPYYSRSAFAMNERLISLDFLYRAGWLKRERYDQYRQEAAGTSSWDEAWQCKERALWDMSHDPDLVIPWQPFDTFCRKNKSWLDDYALFCAVRDFFKGKAWTEWPEDIARHEDAACARYRKELAGAVDHYRFLQYIVHRQWQDVCTYAHDNGVSILGDIPMFVAHDSADCWSHQDLFDLDEAGNPRSVAGVPPDYFSAEGQLWGNPLYDYQAMAKDGYDWWVQRFRHTLSLVDEVRIDHFRGFSAYWSIPAGARTAREGQWKPAPGEDILRRVYQELGPVRLIAEDLGIITDDVCRLRSHFSLPGMRVLPFHLKERSDGRLSFDTEPCSIAYTGTHDNDTTRGWYESLPEEQQQRLCLMLHLSNDATASEVTAALIAYVYSRRAETAIVPFQDLLFLPSSGRMNTPGTVEGNWHWQLKDGQMRLDLARWLSSLCHTYHR
ncbi:4-alpha-glucanotransferase [Megasphaera hexanoica]|uniref:4-alpha-glucanotransferase n=2 Tax=Megasphaera TaxID=906 RepID=A0ABW7DME1_9FIRM|nr:4-alpha-glucanotransferase [Megasphaera hexanoica]AXB82203.1 4-alpha-glucanotransferase [Megasphaera hexanoica]